jgi:hypothetical protein
MIAELVRGCLKKSMQKTNFRQKYGFCGCIYLKPICAYLEFLLINGKKTCILINPVYVYTICRTFIKLMTTNNHYRIFEEN